MHLSIRGGTLNALAPAVVFAGILQSNRVMVKLVPVPSDMSISRRAIEIACEVDFEVSNHTDLLVPMVHIMYNKTILYEPCKYRASGL